MQFGKTIVLASIFLANLEHATGAKKTAVVTKKNNVDAKPAADAKKGVAARRRTSAADNKKMESAKKQSPTEEANTRPHDEKQRELAKAAEAGEIDSIGEDIALLKLDDKVYWNRFLQRDASMPSAMPSAEPTSDGDDDDDDDDDDNDDEAPSASPSSMPSSMPSSSPTANTGGSNPGSGGGSNPGGGNSGGDNKSGKNRALANARGKLILDNIKQTRKKAARNGAKPNDWDNNFF